MSGMQVLEFVFQIAYSVVAIPILKVLLKWTSKLEATTSKQHYGLAATAFGTFSRFSVSTLFLRKFAVVK